MLFLFWLITIQDPETMIQISSTPEALAEAKRPLTTTEKKFLEEAWMSAPTYEEALTALKDPDNRDQYRTYLGLRTQKERGAAAVQELMAKLAPGDPYYLKLLGFLCLLDPATGLKPFSDQASGGTRIYFPGPASSLTRDYLPLFLKQLDGSDAKAAEWAADRIAELLPAGRTHGFLRKITFSYQSISVSKYSRRKGFFLGAGFCFRCHDGPHRRGETGLPGRRPCPHRAAVCQGSYVGRPPGTSL